MGDNDLGPRGAELYKSLVNSKTDPSRKAIALEAARTVDRLDDLNQIIAGKGVLKLMMFRVVNRQIDEEFGEMNLTVDVNFATPLTESRMQATALTGLLKSFQQLDPANLDGAGDKPKPAGPSPEDILAQKRAEREARRNKAQ